MTELAALNIRITGDSGDLTAAVNAAKGQLGGLNAAMTQTQARAGAMGGALGGLAQRMSGARGQIQNVAFQLQDMAVQLQSGTRASVVFAQQGSQIASAFGPVGAVIGALAAVGIPLLSVAFSAATAEASAFTAAAERQKEIVEELTAATHSLRIERQMLTSGAFLTQEQEAMNELVSLGAERVRLQRELIQLDQQEGAQTSLRIAAKRGELATQLQQVDARRREIEEQIKSLSEERSRLEAAKLTKTVQEDMAALMRQMANSDLSGPFVRMLGPLQAAVDKARELANNMGMASGPGPAPGVPSGLGMGVDTLFGNVPVGLGGTAPMASSPRPRAAPNDFGGAFGGGGGGGGGGGLASSIEAELQTLQEGFMSAEQMQMESYQRQQETLQQALDQRLITQEEYQRLMQQAQATHDFAMSQSVNKGVSDTLSALGNLFQGSKKIGAAVALANSWLAFTEVLKDPAYVGRPWARIAAAGNALAAGLNAVRNIKSASPGASGGGGAGASMGAQAAPPQQNVQTLNFSIQNDPFGLGQNIIRQIASQLNEAQRNGSTLIRATVS